MRSIIPSERTRLAIIVWSVLVSQVLLYPGLDETVSALGGADVAFAETLFLVTEFVAFVVFAVAWGTASDVLGRRTPLVVVGGAGGTLSYLAVVSAPSIGLGFEIVLLCRFLGGAFTIGAFSLSITMLMDLTGGHGQNMGVAGTAIGLGAAIGSVVGGQLATITPLTPLYGGALLLALSALLGMTIPDHTPERGGDMSALFERLRDKPVFAVPYAFGFIDRLTAGFFALTGVAFFRDTFAIDPAQAGLTLALFFIPFALLQYPAGLLSDSIGRFIPVVVGSIMYGLGIIAVGMAPSYLVGATLMVVVGGFGALVSPTTMALVTDVAAATERGVAMGGFNVFGSLGMLSGFVLGGVLSTTAGYLPAFLAAGGLELLIAVIAARPVLMLANQTAPSSP
ncbi:MFS transporter [Halocatena halophila]|uniref:MFS transporter n=1 Tax=Halocatena halophila TaxID=2814576 RepID=UPI002ED6A1E5